MIGQGASRPNERYEATTEPAGQRRGEATTGSIAEPAVESIGGAIAGSTGRR